MEIALGSILILVVVAMVSLLLAHSLAAPLEALRAGADRFANGELERRLPVAETAEIGSLAESMNAMAAELNDRINIISHERAIREAVLSSMAECVLAVDGEERVLHINTAAATLFGVSPREGEGLLVQEVVRVSEILRFVLDSIGTEGSAEREITIYDSGERIFKIRTCPLQGSGGGRSGTLAVLNDVTRLRQLESMRQEFVANVSHELRTPITSIKGFVETLLDGPLENEEETRRFLGIVVRQSDRLSAIIEDLLALSRIEREEENGQLGVATMAVAPVLERAIQTCAMGSGQASVELNLVVEEGLTAKVNDALIEQAVINLISNAIKYSAAGGGVTVAARTAEKGGVVIEVTDCGCGIAAEHLPRLFERFYRVDKARSRRIGGTGLGLAIVKHITQLHGGTVGVTSTPGEGSTFTMTLPG